MSKRKQWDEFKNKMSRKRMGKKEGKDSIEYLTVQRLSPSVEGKAQKYTRIGPLTMVPFPHEDKTMENIKQACKDHFDIDEDYQCDVLAGERGPSYTSVNQIKKLETNTHQICGKRYQFAKAQKIQRNGIQAV